MTYGRSVLKSLGKFYLNTARWPELASRRGAWRDMIRTGLAPSDLRPPPSPPPPEPIARTKPVRRCTGATNAAIDSTLRVERGAMQDFRI